MIEVLKADGITSAMVSAGGSSIYGLGTPPDERGWHTVIRDPKDANKTAAEVWLKDESLSTSATTRSFFSPRGACGATLWIRGPAIRP